MSHPVVWFEFMGKNGDELRRFYTQAFGWKIDADNPMQYGMVEALGGRGIPGGIGDANEMAPHPGITVYLSTTDIEASLAHAREHGAEVLMPRTVLPGGTILGFFRDPTGNAVGLVEESA